MTPWGVLVGIGAGFLVGLWIWYQQRHIGKVERERDRAVARASEEAEAAKAWREERDTMIEGLEECRARTARQQELLVRYGRPGAAGAAWDDVVDEETKP